MCAVYSVPRAPTVSFETPLGQPAAVPPSASERERARLYGTAGKYGWHIGRLPVAVDVASSSG